MMRSAAAVPSAAVISACMRDGVEGVGDRHDPRLERNSPAAEAARITSPVPALMMRQNAGGQFWKECLERSEHVGTPGRVGRDRPPIRRRELLPVMHDVE